MRLIRQALASECSITSCPALMDAATTRHTDCNYPVYERERCIRKESILESLNVTAAWIGILAGTVSGLIMGMMFQKENWLGGYGSWSRRLIRLGHISFFGLAFINLAYAFSVKALDIDSTSRLASSLFILGAVSMPVVCFLSAWRKTMRHLFPIPVLSILAGVVTFLITGVLS